MENFEKFTPKKTRTEKSAQKFNCIEMQRRKSNQV